MLKRLRLYATENPIQTWALLVICLGIFYAPLYRACGGAEHRGLTLLYPGFVFGQPTIALIFRFSDKEREIHPVPLRQEAVAGSISVGSFLLSVAAAGSLSLNERVGGRLADDASQTLFLVSAMSALISVAFGYAARYGKQGRLGLASATSWISFVVMTAFVILVGK